MIVPMDGSHPHPIFLITDFGLTDTYVGQMKAALLARAPGVQVVDVTHAVARQDVRAGARAVAEVLAHLPRPSVLLAVVDPGVGTGRRPVAVAAGGLWAVGPDNGLLTPALDLGAAAVHEIDPRRVGAGELSNTFHGRDLFAPAAAALALGRDVAELGPAAADPRRLPAPAVPRAVEGGWRVRIEAVDHFGNLTTNLAAALLQPREAAWVAVLPGGRRAELMATYGEAADGALLALVGSSGFVEIAINGGSAASEAGLAPGDEFEVRCSYPG